MMRSNAAVRTSSRDSVRKQAGRRSGGSESALVWADAGLGLLLGGAPLFLAGRHPIGVFVYLAVLGATVLGYLVWRIRSSSEGWRWSGGEWILGLALLLVAFQCIPLPAEWLERLSPALTRSLSSWFAGSELNSFLGRWSYLSLTPDATRSGLALLLGWAALFVVLLQRIRRREDVELLLHAISAATVAIAVLGLLQFLAGNGKFLWVYEHPFRDTTLAAKGPFTNENHFAHFLALGWGPLMFSCWRLAGPRSGSRAASWASSSRGNEWRWRTVGAVASGLVLFGVCLSFSRGGLLVFLLAALVTGILFSMRGLVPRNVIHIGAILAGTLAVALLIFGLRPLLAELGTLQVRSFRQLAEATGRVPIWSADWAAAQEFWRFGSGVGSHRDVYPIYFDDLSYVEFSHAESGYLQLLVETGLAGLGLTVCGLLLIAAKIWRTVSTRDDSVFACGVAASMSVLVSVLQSVWDFVWYIPACFAVVVIVVACLCRLSQFASSPSGTPDTVPTSRRAGGERQVDGSSWTAIALVSAVFLMALADCWPEAHAALAWDDYFREAQREEPLLFQPGAPRTLVKTSESTSDPVALLQERIERLQRVVAVHPRHAQANLQLAQSYLLLFEHRQRASENPMPLSQIRDAAVASRFSSKADLERWLSVVLGKNRSLLEFARNRALHAVRLSPLQGTGYTYLAELAFLEIRDPTAKRALLEQALAVRPMDGQVLVAAGNEAVLEGDQERAIECWKRAFHREDTHKIQLIEMLGPRLSGRDFVKAMDPDLNGLRYLHRYFVRASRGADVASIGEAYLQRLKDQLKVSPPQSHSVLLREASDVCHSLHDEPRALEFLECALAEDPHDYQTRRALALRLVSYQRYADAIEPLLWCERRNSDDDEIREALKVASREQLTDHLP